MTRRVYVGELEDLLVPEDYDAPDAERIVRIRIQKRKDGPWEVLADSPNAVALDALIDKLSYELGVDVVEALLCG